MLLTWKDARLTCITAATRTLPEMNCSGYEGCEMLIGNGIKMEVDYYGILVLAA